MAPSAGGARLGTAGTLRTPCWRGVCPISRVPPATMGVPCSIEDSRVHTPAFFEDLTPIVVTDPLAARTPSALGRPRRRERALPGAGLGRDPRDGAARRRIEEAMQARAPHPAICPRRRELGKPSHRHANASRRSRRGMAGVFVLGAQEESRFTATRYARLHHGDMRRRVLSRMTWWWNSAASACVPMRK